MTSVASHLPAGAVASPRGVPNEILGKDTDTERLGAGSDERHIQNRVIAVAAWTNAAVKKSRVIATLVRFIVNNPINPTRIDAIPMAAK